MCIAHGDDAQWSHTWGVGLFGKLLFFFFFASKVFLICVRDEKM